MFMSNNPISLKKRMIEIYIRDTKSYHATKKNR